jgi:hypothetical protein
VRDRIDVDLADPAVLVAPQLGADQAGRIGDRFVVDLPPSQGRPIDFRH